MSTLVVILSGLFCLAYSGYYTFIHLRVNKPQQRDIEQVYQLGLTAPLGLV